MDAKVCYDCGTTLIPKNVAKKIIPFPDLGETIEHIPAQMMFEGYTYKGQRIVVPSCFSCNQRLSKIEEELRNYVALAGKGPGLSALVEKTARAMEKQNAWGRGKLFYEGDEIISEFRNDFLWMTCRKHFKGIFFHEFSQPLPKQYKYQLDLINLVKGSERKAIQRIKILDWLLKFPWKHSGHSNVFKYIMQPILQGQPLDGTVIPFTGEEDAVYCVMVCNNTFLTVAGAVRMPE